MKKRTPVNELLDDPIIGTHLRDLCEKNELLVSELLSDKLIRTLKLLTKQSESASLLSYSQIQDLAREAGISDNLSKTTIKQAREMLAVNGRKRDQSKTDMAYYVVSNRLTGLFLMSELDDIDTLKVHSVIADLLIPVVLLKAQQMKTPVKAFHQQAPYAPKIATSSDAGCELFLTLLESPDEETKRMRAYVRSSTRTHLSYATVQKIEKTAQWAFESYRVHGSEVEAVVEVALSLKPSIDRLIQFRIENIGEVVSKMLLVALEAAILSNGVSKNRLYSHF